MHEQVGAHVLERARRAPVEAQERLHPLPRLGWDLRALKRRVERRDHVGLAPARDQRRPREVDRRELDRRAEQRAHDRVRVVWVGEEAEPGEQVPDLGALEEGSGADEPVGDAALVEGGRDELALVSDGAHEHCAGRRLDAVRDQSLELGGNGLGLRPFVLAPPERDRFEPERTRRPACRLQLLLEPLGARLDDRMGGVEDRLARAVVGLEPDHLRVRISLLEVADVLARSAAEAVDRLVVVADHDDVSPAFDQQPEQLVLRQVRVLVLVDEHGLVPVGHALAHRGTVLEQVDRAHDHLAEVDRAGMVEEAVVVAIEARELELAHAPVANGVVRRAGERLGPVRVLVGGHHLVLEPVDPVESTREERRRVPAQLVVADLQVVGAIHQERKPVGLGDRLEERVEAPLERLLVEEARAERVEGRAVELLVGLVEQLLGAGAHLLGRLRREGEGEHARRVDPLRRQPCDPAGDHAGLAAAGSGKHEQWPARVGDGLLLGVVQAVEQLFAHPTDGNPGFRRLIRSATA
jgi:hypothetical protein